MESKKAVLYRMVTPEHICPFGTKAKYLLESEGYTVEDHHLRTRSETDEFKTKENVKTTPQAFIEGKRVGGYDDLRAYFHKKPTPKKGERTYKPVVALFSVAALMAISITWSTTGTLIGEPSLRLFGGISMALLALQKLADLNSFSNSFLNYDLLSVRFVPYAFIYPFAELASGLGMLSGSFPAASGIVALAIGTEGAISVVKAVYVDRRELTCACMGGNANVPLGFISLLENLLMVVMGAFMLSM